MLLYKSPADPQIEKDVKRFEDMHASFAKKYDTAGKEYLSDPAVLASAIKDLEAIEAFGDRPSMYFYFLRDIEAENKAAISNLALLDIRLTKAVNKTRFFSVLLGKVSPEKQREFLSDERLAPFKVFLQRIFDDAKYRLSIDEEKIISLKSLPAYEMWVAGNEKILNMQTVPWKGKQLPIAQAIKSIQGLRSAKDRAKLSSNLSAVLKQVASFSEAEINAVITNKKINDELRGYKTPYENTVLGYRNDPEVVENLIKAVTSQFRIAHRFHKIKARILGLKSMSYADRIAPIGEVSAEFSFKKSVDTLKKTFAELDPKYADILDGYIRNGQIDVPPRIGKKGGAYCWGSQNSPTFVLLNHVDDLNSFTTLAHELGHAFHTEASKSQRPLYSDYSTSLAETASTLFEAIALNAVYDSLSDKEKLIVLHDKIGDFVSTVFRQIACFNYENDLHATIRAKGFMSKEEIADSHNRNMQAYLGPSFKLTRDDGYYFVHWSHIRRFFYVYSYAYGLLVSSALLRRYRQDKSFWKKIEQYLSSGGKDSPENILREIGLDVSSPGFWMEGLKAVEEDLDKLERLTAKKK
jgi:oligoendopeptidase F